MYKGLKFITRITKQIKQTTDPLLYFYISKVYERSMYNQLLSLLWEDNLNDSMVFESI